MASATARAAVLLLAAGTLGVGGWSWATHWRPSPAIYKLQGVALPLDARPVDWGSVRAAGADFAYLVATAGTHARDPGFEANWQALPEAGLRRGAVHLYSLCEDGEPQADAFNATVPRADDALPPAVDVDLPDGCAAPAPGPAVTDALRRFVARVETHMGKPVILRLSRAAERRYALSTALDRPLWVTGDLLRPGYAARPWRLWRASDMRQVDGVEGRVNWDVVAP